MGLILRRPILGTCIIPILPNGMLVLVRRRDSGLWGLPGGIIDWNEDIWTAARREVYEETGLTIVGLERLVGIYSHPDRDPRFHSVCVTVAAQVTGIPIVKDVKEIVEVKEFPLEQLPQETLSHDHSRQLKDYMEKVDPVLS